MKEIITNIDELRKPTEAAEFITDKIKLDPDKAKEYNDIINNIKQILSERDDLTSLSATQLGYSSRIFCIKFSDCIKSFINPILKRKSKEKFISFEKHPDGEHFVYVCRPTELEAIFYTDEFKYEENTLKDGTAAIFMQNSNLLDGIIPGDLLSLDADDIDPSFAPALVDATYSGSGILVDKDTQLDLEEVANQLSDYCSIFNNCVEDICSSEDDTTLKKLTRQFRYYERVALGDVTSLDGLNLKKTLLDERKAAKGQRTADFRKFAERKCRR